jgi:6-phosphogluconolactonase (cycloisomerase 2 family)
MKSLGRIIAVFSILFLAVVSTAQTLTPRIIFKENPLTHNMHITSDGKFLYTCNGGKSEFGQISKFTMDGNKTGSYKIELDMRSIMFNASDKKLYVHTYEQKLYRIDDLEKGIYSEVFDFRERNEQSVPAISHNGKLIYFMEYGQVFVYSIKNKELKTTLSGLNSTDNATDGGTALAVDKKNIYCWDAAQQTVYIYDLKGKFRKSVKFKHGSYGFSLSNANGLLWVSDDGNYEEGMWYGYVVE